MKKERPPGRSFLLAVWGDFRDMMEFYVPKSEKVVLGT